MLLCAGLGNPGRRYQDTRHNLGFMVLDALADALKMRWQAGKGSYFAAEGMVGDLLFRMIKPMTYMNRSGLAVREAMDCCVVSPDQILVVVDDVNLPLGKLRLRMKGGAGGHNGLASIITEIGSDDFPRLRLGIGMPETDELIAYVLGSFGESEWPAVREMADRAAESIRRFVSEGADAAINFCNTT
ncbi:MAG: aminoacyl-tRNA hydrolase [Candidatus Latescibacterota bacterium]